MDVFSDLRRATIRTPEKKYRPAATWEGTLTKAVADYLSRHPGSTSYSIGKALNAAPSLVLSTLYRLELKNVLHSKYLPPKRGTAHERAAELVKHYWRME